MKWRLWPALLLILVCCKGTKTREQIKEVWSLTKKNVPVIVVGVVLIPLGPFVQIGGMVITNVTTDLIDSKADLSSGEVVTEAQMAKEMARWRGEAIAARKVASASETARDWLYTVVQYAIVGFIGMLLVWLHWRNRHNWARSGYWKGVWVHGVFGGSAGTVDLDKERVINRLS